MKQLFRGLLVAGWFGLLVAKATAGPDAATGSDFPPVSSRAVNGATNGLPKVLIIGDSISMGYTPHVQRLLQGQADVRRIPENGGPTTNGLAKLREWLGAERWDVIHFNWGLHDLKIMADGARQVPTNQYAANLRVLARQLRATGARLIWASTTPVPSPEEKLQVKRAAADVPVYNAIARAVMREYGVPSNELHDFAAARLAEIQKPHDVHYTDAGSAALAQPVAAAIAAQLANRFTDAEGVICFEAENFSRQSGWRRTEYYTGLGMSAPALAEAAAGLEFDLTVATPGRYPVHLLGNRRRNTPVASNLVEVQLAPVGGDFRRVGQLRFHELNAPAWTEVRADGEPGGVVVEFPAPGEYRLRLAAPAGGGFYVDKVVLSRTNHRPEGCGPEETRLATQPLTGEGFDPLVVLPPAWAFGVLYGGYTDQAQTLETVDRLLAAGFPVDAYWLDSWFWDFADQGRGPQGYMNFQEDRSAYPDVAMLFRQLEQRGIKAGVWVWDCILREKNEAVFDEFHQAKAFKEVFIERNRWHNRTGLTICGNIDFDNPAAVALWRSKLAPFFERGLDFLKIDRSSDIAFSRAAFEATQELGRETGGRGFILAHLHSTHDPRHKLYPIKWTGDAKIAWSQPDYPNLGIYAMGGFRENIGMVADARRSTYAVPFLSHDAGGYDFFGGEEFSEELFVRWVQFACLNTVTHLFSHPRNETRNHPTAFSPAAQDAVRKYFHLRLRLFPYLYTHALNTRLTGRKMVRAAAGREYQYLLGGDLLVAPVFEKGATQWEVALPPGRWREWSGGQWLEGGRTVTVKAPLEKLPLFVREGALLPLREYAPRVEAGTSDRLELLVFPGAQPSEFTLQEDDGRSNDYLEGRIAATPLRLEHLPSGGVRLRVEPVVGDFAGMNPRRDWTVVLPLDRAPTGARLNGRPVAVSWDAGQGVARVSFPHEKSRLAELILE